jgi:hypothetical protein
VRRDGLSWCRQDGPKHRRDRRRGRTGAAPRFTAIFEIRPSAIRAGKEADVQDFAASWESRWLNRRWLSAQIGQQRASHRFTSGLEKHRSWPRRTSREISAPIAVTASKAPTCWACEVRNLLRRRPPHRHCRGNRARRATGSGHQEIFVSDRADLGPQRLRADRTQVQLSTGSLSGLPERPGTTASLRRSPTQSRARLI